MSKWPLDRKDVAQVHVLLTNETVTFTKLLNSRWYQPTLKVDCTSEELAKILDGYEAAGYIVIPESMQDEPYMFEDIVIPKNACKVIFIKSGFNRIIYRKFGEHWNSTGSWLDDRSFGLIVEHYQNLNYTAKFFDGIDRLLKVITPDNIIQERSDYNV